MLIEIILALLIGVSAGTITGLLPGIHINLISIFIITFIVSKFTSVSSLNLIIFITAMAIAHTFIDFIPSVFLGCPDTDTELSVLPGHEMLKKGRGHEAILLSLLGSSSAIVVILFLTPLTVWFLPKIYPLIKILIPYLLIIATSFIIIREKNKSNAIIILLLTGFLGLFVLNNQFIQIKQPLLPLLTGLFGGSMLVLSIKQNIKIPEQKICKIKKVIPRYKYRVKQILKPIIASAIASPFCCFMPALGSGQAAVIGSQIGKLNQKDFLILIGTTNTIVIGLSFIALYTLNITRTGAAAAIKQLSPTLTTGNLLIILLTIFLTGTICFFWTIFLSKKFTKIVEKLPYTTLSILTLVFVSTVVFAFSNWIGVLIFITSTAIGLLGISMGVRRVNFMGCLLLPTILFYLFL